MPQQGHCCPLPVSPLPGTATGPGRAPNSTQHPKSRLPGCVPAASPPPAAQDPVPVRGHRRCRGHREQSLWPGHTSLHSPGPAPAPGLMMDKPPPSPTPSWGALWQPSRAWNGASRGWIRPPARPRGLQSGSTRGPPCTQHLGVAPSSTTLAGWDARDGAPTSAPQPGSEDRTCPRTPGAHTCPATPRDSVSPFFKGSCSPPSFGLSEGWRRKAGGLERTPVSVRPSPSDQGGKVC